MTFGGRMWTNHLTDIGIHPSNEKVVIEYEYQLKLFKELTL